MIKLKPINFPTYEELQSLSYIKYKIRKTSYLIYHSYSYIAINLNTAGYCHDSKEFDNSLTGYEQARQFVESERKEALEEIINGELEVTQ